MLSSLLFGLAHLATIVLNLAVLVLIISAAMSWFDLRAHNRFVTVIEKLSYALCRPFYRWTRKIPGPFDWAPFCAMLVLVLLQKVLPVYLMSLSFQMK